MLKHAALLALSLILFAAAAQAQQDPFVGTWKENLAKSKYEPGPPPAQGNSVVITSVANGIKVSTKRPNGQTPACINDSTAYYDDKYYPSKDSAGTSDSMKLHKVFPGSLVVTFMRAGKVTRTATWNVSADQKTLTCVALGPKEQSPRIYIYSQYDRQ